MSSQSSVKINLQNLCKNDILISNIIIPKSSNKQHSFFNQITKVPNHTSHMTTSNANCAVLAIALRNHVWPPITIHYTHWTQCHIDSTHQLIHIQLTWIKDIHLYSSMLVSEGKGETSVTIYATMHHNFLTLNLDFLGKKRLQSTPSKK
jgi:hypothetical protein